MRGGGAAGEISEGRPWPGSLVGLLGPDIPRLRVPFQIRAHTGIDQWVYK